ncbi:unnamed protein product [Linum trigynum]|uniref:Copia protein n=1 Tax=Linum trigynum TaxID=586398 RepID=A0AAV2CCX6_9ROSI
MADLSCELQWLCYLFNDLNIQFADPFALYCDNTSAIRIAENPVAHERTKHIEIDCHLIREKIAARLIKLFYISTDSQLADVLTKSLSIHRFVELIGKLGMCDIHAPA